MAKDKGNVAVKSEKARPEGSGLATTAAREREGHPLLGLRNEINRLFDDFFSGRALSPFHRGFFDWDPFWRSDHASAATVPSVDVTEDDKAFRIAAEMPGMDEDDIEVTLSDGVLRLKGEKKEEKEERDENYYLSERRYGSFERSFRLPDSIDQDRIEANLKNGVLTITLPKTAEARMAARKIEVKSK